MAQRPLLRRVWPILFIALVALGPVLATSFNASKGGSAPSSGRTEAVRFSYGEGSIGEGTLVGKCSSLSATHDGREGDVVVGTAEGGRFHIVESWSNITVAPSAPGGFTLDSGSRHRIVEFAAGPFELRNLADQRLLLQSPEMIVGFQADFLRAGEATAFEDAEGVPGSAEFRGLHGGSGRGYEIRGGPVSIGAEVLVVSFDEGEFDAGPVRERASSHDAPRKWPTAPGGLTGSSYRHDAWIVLSRAQLKLEPDGTRPHCRTLDVDIDGQFTAQRVQGESLVDGVWAPLTDPTLRLEGRFALHEEIAPLANESGPADQGAHPGPPTMGQARFRVGAASSVAQTRSLDASRGLAMGALVAAVALGVWKLSAFLYSRFAGQDALESPTRKRILETVRARPGLALDELCDATGLHYSATRHHVRVLQRNRYITMFKVRGVWHLAPDAPQARAELPRLLLDGDDAAAKVVAHAMRPGGACVGDVVRDLEVDLGLSRSGARKAIGRTLRSHQVEKVRRGRTVVLQASSTTTPRVRAGAGSDPS